MVSIVDYGSTLVFDMSYEGAAFAQPKEKKIDNIDDKITLHLKTEIDEAKIPATAIRVSDEVVAVQFDSIDVAARVIIDRVVTDRIVGLNMNLIDPKHYSAKADFNFWFHGPKDTNLYLWGEGDQLIKAQMETSDSAMVFEDDMLLFENKAPQKGIPTMNNQQIALKVLAIVQQIEEEIPALNEFKKMIKSHVQT